MHCEEHRRDMHHTRVRATPRAFGRVEAFSHGLGDATAFVCIAPRVLQNINLVHSHTFFLD